MPAFVRSATPSSQRLAKYTDPSTLQYVAGHDNIKATMRYVRPQANAVDKLFVLADPDRESGFAPQRQVRRIGAKSGARQTGNDVVAHK